MSGAAKLACMNTLAEFAGEPTDATARDHTASKQGVEFDLAFLPETLTTQCRSLIESYHEVRGFACLPDVLWKFGLGPFIERQPELRQFLKRRRPSAVLRNPTKASCGSQPRSCR